MLPTLAKNQVIIPDVARLVRMLTVTFGMILCNIQLVQQSLTRRLSENKQPPGLYVVDFAELMHLFR